MAVGFTEYATLKLNERSAITSIRKVNTELKKLDRTSKSLARSLRSIPNLSRVLGGAANTRGLTETTRKLDRINRQLRSMQRIQVRTTGISQTIGELQRLSALLTNLRRQASRPINIRVNQPNPSRVSPGSRGAFLGTGTAEGGYRRGLMSAFGGISIGEIVAYGAIITIASGVIEGTRDRALEAARFENLQLRPGERLALERERQRVSLGGALTGTEAGLLTAELFPTSQFQPAVTGAMVNALEPMFNNLLATNQDRDRAFDELSQVMRGIEQRGGIYDPQGNLIVGELRSAVRVEEQVQSVLGENYSAAFQRRLTKMLGAAKFGMSPEAYIMLSLMGEEMSTRAAVGFNQVQKQLFRPTSDDRASAQRALGIRDAETGVIQPELLQSNLPRWISTVLVPAAKKAGVPIESISDFQNLSGSIIGDVRGQESLVAFLARSDELFRTVDRSMENIESGTRPDNARNAFVVWSNLIGQFTSTLGTIGEIITRDFKGPLESITRGLALFEENLRSMNPAWRKVGEGVLALGGLAFTIRTLTGTFALLTGATRAQAVASGQAAVASRGLAVGLGRMMVALAALPFAIEGLKTLLDPLGLRTGDLNRGEQKFLQDVNNMTPSQLRAAGLNGNIRSNRPTAKPNLGDVAERRIQRGAMGFGLPDGSPYPEQMALLGNIVNRAGQTLTAAEVAALSAGQQAASSIMTASEQAANSLDDGITRGVDEMRQAGFEMGRSAADLLIEAGPTLGQSIAGYLEQAIVDGAARARFQWPGGPRTNISTSSDLGYQGSGDSGGGSAATTAMGLW